MEDRSTAQKPWYEFGQIINTGAGFEVRDLLVRWGERTETREGESGEEITEYVYDYACVSLQLDPDIRPGTPAVEYYLDQAKDAIVARAQALASQREGFDAAE
jgi:hypothetical protein